MEGFWEMERRGRRVRRRKAQAKRRLEPRAWVSWLFVACWMRKNMRHEEITPVVPRMIILARWRMLSEGRVGCFWVYRILRLLSDFCWWGNHGHRRGSLLVLCRHSLDVQKWRSSKEWLYSEPISSLLTFTVNVLWAPAGAVFLQAYGYSLDHCQWYTRGLSLWHFFLPLLLTFMYKFYLSQYIIGFLKEYLCLIYL